MMAPRLSEFRHVLKQTGSLYLHCDPTASHYLKLLLDAVFAPQQFRNEIVWKRTTAPVAPRNSRLCMTCCSITARPTGLRGSGRVLITSRRTWTSTYRFDDGDGRLYWRGDLCAAGVRHARATCTVFMVRGIVGRPSPPPFHAQHTLSVNDRRPRARDPSDDAAGARGAPLRELSATRQIASRRVR